MPSSRGYKDLESGAVGGVNAVLNEGIGTFFIALTLFSAISGSLDKALAVGGMLAFWTWLGPDGAYNPTICVLNVFGSNASMSVKSALLAIAGQVSGAIAAFFFQSMLGSAPVVTSAGDLSAGLTDFLLTFVFLGIYTSESAGLDRGLGYFSGLAAFSSQFGANASVVLGVVLGNAFTGNVGLSIGAMTAVAVPLVTAALFPLFWSFIMKTLPTLMDKVNKNLMTEVVATFFFALLLFAISSGGDALAPLAVGTSLMTVHSMWPDANLNPVVTISVMVKNNAYSTWLDALLHILGQTLGATVAVIVASFMDFSCSVPAASTLGAPVVLEVLFASILGLFYVASPRRDNLAAGLTYFACITSFASIFNPALHLGLYIASLAGFGSAVIAATSIVAPLIGGTAAGLLHGATRSDLNEAIGALLLFVTLGSLGGSALGTLALGAMLSALSTIFPNAVLNPAFLAAKLGTSINTILFQVVGSVAGALFAQWAGVADGASVSKGLGGGKPAVAEFLLLTLLLKVGEKPDGTSKGLSYFALLTVFGQTAGSIGNPVRFRSPPFTFQWKQPPSHSSAAFTLLVSFPVCMGGGEGQLYGCHYFTALALTSSHHHRPRPSAAGWVTACSVTASLSMSNRC